jgi:hypothetical protein
MTSPGRASFHYPVPLSAPILPFFMLSDPKYSQVLAPIQQEVMDGLGSLHRWIAPTDAISGANSRKSKAPQ